MTVAYGLYLNASALILHSSKWFADGSAGAFVVGWTDFRSRADSSRLSSEVWTTVYVSGNSKMPKLELKLCTKIVAILFDQIKK